jgi:hypothetical protein
VKRHYPDHGRGAENLRSALRDSAFTSRLALRDHDRRDDRASCPERPPLRRPGVRQPYAGRNTIRLRTPSRARRYRVEVMATTGDVQTATDRARLTVTRSRRAR